ncbi:chemotaxis signal transduction protein [Rhizobium paranaense]|uniref:Chemotaxis signal transduction protein n=1 Tax=Rhizobium paranaense TaxID=1650438 RepID=A0A7W9D4Y0_9HYPH|nr:chemotaxis signal transduction protein [Rhizobium paranaense]
MPLLARSFDASYAYGIIPLEQGMVCFLNLNQMFEDIEGPVAAA